MNNFIFWISRKLKTNSDGNGANATGMTIAVIGVALSLLVLECTLAIVVGFKSQITQRILGFDGEISLLPAYDHNTGSSEEYVSFSPALQQAIREILPQGNASMKFQQPAILKTDSDFAGLYFIGYDSAYNYDFQRANIIEGELPNFFTAESANTIIVSKTMADNLQLSLGDKVNACFFVNEAIKSRKFEIGAIYESGFSDYDKTIAYAPMATLQKIAVCEPDQATSITVSASGFGNIESDAANLQNRLIAMYHANAIDKLYPIDNVKHTGAIFFNWLQLLDTNVVVIFILMSSIAAFTLVSSMFILILDRIKMIGLLRALGATRRQIRLIFISMAMKVVALGLLIGNIAGIGLLLAQDKWHIMKLDPDMYYLPYVPIDINWNWFVVLNVCVLIMAWLILILPSKVAAKVSPAETMKFD